MGKETAEDECRTTIVQCHRRQGGLRFGKALSATWNERPGVVEVSENRSSIVRLKEEGEPHR